MAYSGSRVECRRHVVLCQRNLPRRSSLQRYICRSSGHKSTQDSFGREYELEKLLCVLPERIRRSISEKQVDLSEVIEIVLDYGRQPLVRIHRDYDTGQNKRTGGPGNRGRDMKLSLQPVTREELDHVVGHCSDFADDNRAGIDGTLHRISAIRNRAGDVVGITCRVGEAVKGSAAMVGDLVVDGHSVLLLGRPGVGKTTVIREISRMLADESLKRVMIVDTSNEIGGDGDICHPGIGNARRMQVQAPTDQHRVMIEAVENHMPNVIVIDEIGTEDESLAARSISQRGVQLIATAHGNCLENVMKNPSLSDLIGGISSVTLGDQESKRRGVQKSVLERTAPPTFDVVIEMMHREQWIIHTNVAESVDSILRGEEPEALIRSIGKDNQIKTSTDGALEAREELLGSRGILNSRRIFEQPHEPDDDEPGEEEPGGDEEAGPSTHEPRLEQKKTKQSSKKKGLQVYIEGVEQEVIEEITMELEMEARLDICASLDDADAVLTSRVALKTNEWLKEVAKCSKIPLFLVRSGTKASISKGLQKILSNKDMLPGRLVPHTQQPASAQSTKVTVRPTGGILECKSAIDEFVLRKNAAVEIVPRDAETMQRVTAMIQDLSLHHEILQVGNSAGLKRVRVMPKDFNPSSSDTRPYNRSDKSVEFW